MLVFCSLGLATPMRRPRYGLRTTSEHLQSEIWPEFRLRVQRYVNETGFCKSFRKKVQKKCIFVDFQAKNSEFLERSVLFSSTLRIQYVCYDLLCVLEWIGVYLIS
jgi:hypothetical protein